MNELDELKDQIASATALMEAVPFGQSAYQNVYLADDSGDPETFPERKLRYVLLQLNAKLGVMQECTLKRRELDIDLREAQEELVRVSKIEGTTYQKERLFLTIERKTLALESQGKMIRDCVIEIRTYLAMLDKLPKSLTRSQFEDKEASYWTDRLKRQAILEFAASSTISAGTLDALFKVGVQAKRLTDGSMELLESKPEQNQ